MSFTRGYVNFLNKEKTEPITGRKWSDIPKWNVEPRRKVKGGRKRTSKKSVKVNRRRVRTTKRSKRHTQRRK